MENFFAQFTGELSYLLVGMFGGLAYRLYKSKPISFGSIIRNMVVSSFSGLMGGILCANFWPEYAFLLAGLFGFLGGFGIYVVMTTLIKKAGIDLPDEMLNKINTDGRDIIDKLQKDKQITVQEYCDIVCGDFSKLHELLDNDTISGQEFEYIQNWQKGINTDGDNNS